MPHTDTNCKLKKMDDEVAKAFVREEQMEFTVPRKFIDDTKEADLHAQLNKLLNLYYFAEKYFINGLMDQTMDRLREGLENYDGYFGHAKSSRSMKTLL